MSAVSLTLTRWWFPEPGNIRCGLCSIFLWVLWTAWTGDVALFICLLLLLDWRFCWLEARRVLFPFSSPPGEEYWEYPPVDCIENPLSGFWVFCSLELFRAWLGLFFRPVWGAGRTVLNPRHQRSWTNTRKCIKIHQLWLLRGGGPHQKFSSCSALGCYVISSSPFQRQKGPAAIMFSEPHDQPVYFSSLGIFLRFFFCSAVDRCEKLCSLLKF